MPEFKIKTVCYDGKVIEVKVNFAVWKFDKDDFWKNDWQERKRKQENSIEELSEEELGQVVGGRNVYNLGLISDSAETEYFRKFTNEILQKAMSELSEKQRRRIMFHYFENLTFEEIAKIENVSIQSANGSVKYALQNLKKILESI
jgi:RNA polymerase sigma factor (sigma-70 family)